MQLHKYMKVGKSVLSNTGMSDAMIAEMFEAVSLFLRFILMMEVQARAALISCDHFG